MKDRLTKLFTTFLAVVLLVGMSPAAASTAYAASWNSGTVASLDLGNKLSGFFDRLFGNSNKNDSNQGQTGQNEEKDSIEQGGNQLTANGGTSNSTPKDIALTKTATDKGKDNAGNQIFDISLGVTGDKVSTARPVDVTLVIDTSASMRETDQQGQRGTSKMDATKTAAKAFVSEVLKDGSSARISVVQFATNASAAIFDSSGNYSNYRATKNNNQKYYSNSAKQVTNAIEALKYNSPYGGSGATNTEGGAVMAKIVTDSRDRSDADSIVIFLTDGVPTYYSNGGVTGSGGDGLVCENTTFTKATSAFANLKQGNRLYGIGFLTSFSADSSESKICQSLLSDQAYYNPSISSWNNRNGYGYNYANFTADTSKSANFTKYYGITKEDSDASTKIKSIYKELSTIINSLASGTIVDKIPEGFELTADALAAIQADANAEYDAINRTVTYKNVEAGENKVTKTFEVKYVGNGYGAAYTNVEAKYNATLYTGNAVSKDFPKPVAGLHPKTVDDADSTSVGTTITVDVRKNDNFKKLTVTGYEVSDYTIVLTDKDGNPKTYDGDFTASIVDGKLQFKSSTAGTKELYYVVKANITKEGSNFAIDGQKQLESRPTKVTIDVYGAANKAYVVDFGKPVTYTDTFTEAEKQATITLNGATNNVKTGAFGNMTLNGNGDSITYKLTKFMDDIDVFTFNELYNNKVNVDKTVSMVPASSIYYEDNFADEDGNTLIHYGEGWKVAPLKPGKDEVINDIISGVAGDGNLGYDSAYDTSDSQLVYSAGTIHYVPKSTTAVTADFTFKGQGIDLYSYTSGATGKFTFRVYDGDTRVFNKTINTKYNSGEAYQVPVVTFMGEQSKTYRVEIIVPKNNAFYLDAVRIYNSVNVNKDQIGGVDVDNESSAKFVSIREQSLLSNNAGLFTVKGDVFIDAYLKNNAKVVAIPDKMNEYTTYGRKTEVVVAPGSSVILTLNKASEYSKVQLGARIDAAIPSVIDGVDLSKINANGKVLVNNEEINIKSSTDMYYTVNVVDGKLVITNNTNKLLALTKLKLVEK